jgi:hypothetical protein
MSLHPVSVVRALVAALSITTATVCALPVHAGTIVFGDTGWQAEWDSSLDAFVDVDFMVVLGNTIFIEKAAEFTQPPINGVFAPIVITFRQTAASTIDRIVMDDEIVINSTGRTWTGFTMRLGDAAGVSFNPAMTAASGGGGPIGFAIDPFTTATFTDSNRQLNVADGTLDHDDIWYPGTVGQGGQLWMNIQSGQTGDFRTFELHETPLITSGPPICQRINAPGSPPDCASSGNTLTASASNVTAGTTFSWQVTSGPCAITSGANSLTITYSFTALCEANACCNFQLTVDNLSDQFAASECELDLCCTPCGFGQSCRVTGGGHDKSVDHALSPTGGVNRYTWGGQAGAPNAAQPQPFGEWTHRQHSGPAGKWTFHAGTHSAPDGTEIDLISCCDPGFCQPARPAPAHQINFQGIGTFRNIGKSKLPPGAVSRGPNLTFHWFSVHIEDAGEPGSHKLPANGICPELGFNCAPLDCRCPDFYRMTIYKGVSRGQQPNTPDKIYEVNGYLDGGNHQIHPPIGDVNNDQTVNNLDLGIVIANLGRADRGDVNGDGRINNVDVALVIAHFGETW